MYTSMFDFPNSLFGQFDRLRRELDDVFGESGFPSSIRSVAAGTLPAMNMGRTPTSVEVYAFAPGMDASKMEITLDRGVLRIAGERPSTIPDGKSNVNVYTRERASGRFTRAITLPEDIDPDKIQASYRDGVLQVSIARRETAQPKRIAVQ